MWEINCRLKIGKKWYLTQNKMYIGRYYHKIEKEGRVSIPKAFRQEVREWIVTRGLDGGLFLFASQDFQTQIQDLAKRTFTKKNDRDFVRYMTNDAYQIEVDNNGRVLLPEYLKKFANLNKDVVIVGSYNRIEIWDVSLYHQYIDQIEQQAERLAENIYEYQD